MLFNTLRAPAIKKPYFLLLSFALTIKPQLNFFSHYFSCEGSQNLRLLVQGHNKHGLYEKP